ncbi:uncharacterized protein LOC115982968 isoform X3 [Quercus lobata]|uniref:uncharacterized protein LOC115982968 isoform X3 n=1 Tax=Quercus lobata TaxID=97700 RepID=UPI0012468D35|nr:uncharacterized protein LOC115982968 isoform X3 [Quercus lobata]
MLQKMLNQEENMHEVLEHILNQHNGSAVSIPNFLPPKIKQLLAELAMVEGEILRLEGQISELQKSLKLEHEVTKESKSKQWKHGTLSNRVGRSSPTTNTNHINKVEKLGNSRGFADQKENLLHEAVKFQDKIPRKSGMLKPSSPLREPRHPSPKWLVLLPVVLTLIATNNNDTKIVDAIADLCYTKWALEAFVIANAKRYSGAWLITRCGSLMTSGYDLNHWYRCLAFLILTGILFRAIAFFFMVTFQKK